MNTMEKGKKMRNNKLKFVIIVIIFLIIAIISIQVFDIKYSVADDYLINNIVCGALEDAPDYQLLYINQFIGVILMFFYNIINVNWYSLLLIILLVFAYSMVVYRIISTEQKIKIILIIPLLALFLFTLFNITYTIIAYICVSFALIDFIYKDKINKKNKVIYILLISTGLLLRKQVFLPIIISMGIILILNIFLKKDKEKLKALIIITSIVLLIVVSLNIIFSLNKQVKAFENWHSECINIRDYKKIEYEKNKSIFDSVGWSKNDLDLIYTWSFADSNTYSIENLKEVSSSINIFERYNLNPQKIILNFIAQFTIIEQSYIFIFVLLLLISLKVSKQKWEVILMLLITLGVNLALIIRDRYPFRVVYPQYLIAMIYYVYIIFKETDIKSNLNNILIIISSMVSIIFIFVFAHQYYIEFKEPISSVNEFITYINENKQNLYILDSETYNYITMNYNILESKKVGIFNNVIKLGGGDIYSRRYYYYVEKYGLESENNLYANLGQDNVYYVGRLFTEMLQYLKEHNLEEYKFIEDKQINNAITIYKIEK